MYNDIKLLVEESKRKVYKMVNTEMINLYWSIGKMIVDKQGKTEKAKYKDYFLNMLPKFLMVQSLLSVVGLF